MRRGEDSTSVNNVLLRESILQSITYLQSKVYLQEKEVYELVRAFFKEYLGLDYEFTHDELLIELQNVFYDKSLEDQVLGFLRKISKVEYSDEEYKPEELKKLLDEFSSIVQTLIKKKNKGKSFLKKLIFWKEHGDEQIPVEKEEEEEIAEVIEDMEKEISVDKKKDLFGREKVIQQRKNNDIEEQSEDLDNKKLEKQNNEPVASENKQSSISNEKSVNHSLLSITKELNDHIEKNRSYSKVSTSAPIKKEATNKVNNKSLNEKLLSQNSVENTSNTALKNEDKLKENIEIPLPDKEDTNQSSSDKPSKEKNLKQLLNEMKKDPSISLYQEIQNKYNAMSFEEQKKYYSKVMEAYNKINEKNK